MLYLILHKVRGQPAFDIAMKLDPETWIIPTSGHRAYPYWTHPLSDILNAGYWANQYKMPDMEIPPDWPDHYTQSEAMRHPKVNPKPVSIEDLLI